MREFLNYSFDECKKEVPVQVYVSCLSELILYGKIGSDNLNVQSLFKPIIEKLQLNPDVVSAILLEELSQLTHVNLINFSHTFTVPEILVWGHNISLQNNDVLMQLGFNYLTFLKDKLNQLSIEQCLAIGVVLRDIYKDKLNFITFFKDDENFSDWEVEALSIIFKKAGVTSLDLTPLQYSFTNPNQYHSFARMIEKSAINHLNLLTVQAEMFFSESQWNWFCKMISDSKISSLDLAGFQFQDISFNHWEKIFLSLKQAGVKNLGLEFKFNKFPTPQWAWLGTQLREVGIEKLNLSDCNFHKFNKIQWECFSRGINLSGISSVDLTLHNFQLATEENSSGLINTISNCKLKEIKLSCKYYELDSKTWVELGEAFKKSGIKCFSCEIFKSIDFIRDTSEIELMNAVSGLNIFLKISGIQSLTLITPDFEVFSSEAWHLFCKGIFQSSVTTLNINYGDSTEKQKGDIEWIMKQKNNHSLKYYCTSRLWKLPEVKIDGHSLSISDMSLPEDIKNLMLDNPASKYGYRS